MWKFFLIGHNRSTNQRSGMILEVQIRNFGARAGARASKFSFSKNSRGFKYQYFFLKIGMKLPFTIKYKRRNTNFKFEFQNYFIFTPEKARFWFLKKNTQKKARKKMMKMICLLQSKFKNIQTSKMVIKKL